MAQTRYLVTGGAGFIGSNIAARLVREGGEVRILDNLSTGRKENLEGDASAARFIEGDIRDPETIREAVEGVDYVLHQAAIPSVQRSVEDPRTSLSVSIDGTLTVLQAALKAGVKRVVYAASSSAYGSSPQLPKVESINPTPMSPYAVGKLGGENLCRAFYHCYGLQTLSLRYFNVFGPNQDPHSQYAAVIPNFISAMLAGRSPVIYGDGKQSRDFTFVQNVVDANLKACQVEETHGEVVNLASGVRTDLLELLDHLAEIFGSRPDPRFEPARAGDVRHSWADISAARELLGFEVLVHLKEGLARTVDFYREKLRP